MLDSWFEIDMKGPTPEILIYDEIGKNFFGEGMGAQDFDTALKKIGPTKKINIRINSPGGNIHQGNAIFSMLKAHPAEKTVIIEGLAASMASLVAMAGDIVQMTGNSMMMIHNPSTIVSGDSKELTRIASILDKFKGVAVDVYSGKSGIDKSKVSDMMDVETWMTAAEAKANKFIDDIIDSIDIQNSFDLSMYENAPKDFFKNKEKPKMSNLEPTPIPEQIVQQIDMAASLADAEMRGSQKERARILAIDAMAMIGCEDLVKKAKEDPTMDAGKLAIQMVQHMKAVGNRTMGMVASESPKVIPPMAESSSGLDFISMVNNLMANNGLTKRAAILQTAKDNPTAHQKYIEKANGGLK